MPSLATSFPYSLHLMADPQSFMEFKEVLEAIDEALANHPPRYLEAYVMRYVRGMSYREIGEQQNGVTPERIRQILFRANRRIYRVAEFDRRLRPYLPRKKKAPSSGEQMRVDASAHRGQSMSESPFIKSLRLYVILKGLIGRTIGGSDDRNSR